MKNYFKGAATTILVALLLAAGVAVAQNTANYMTQGGSAWVVGTREGRQGTLTVQSGATLTVDAGGFFAMDATSTFSNDVTLDDGTTDSPSLIFQNASDATTTILMDGALGGDGRLELTSTEATGGLNVLTGNIWIGNGAPTETIDGEDLYVEGLSEFDGAANFDGTADFDGTVDMSSEVTTSGNFSSTGPALFTGTADFDGIVDFDGTVDMSSEVTTSGNFSSTGEAFFDGLADFDGNVDMSSEVTSSGNLSNTGSVFFSGTSLFSGTADFDSTADFDGTVDMSSEVTASGNFSSTGPALFSSTADFDGVVDFDGTVDMSSEVTASGNFSSTGEAFFDGLADFDAFVDMSSDVTSTGNFSSSGVADFTGTLQVGSVTVSATAVELDEAEFTVFLEDVSSASTAYVVVPAGGTISAMYAVPNGMVQVDATAALTVWTAPGDGTLFSEVTDGTDAPAFGISATSVTSTGGTVLTFTPTLHADVTKGSVIAITTDGGSTLTVDATITIIIDR